MIVEKKYFDHDDNNFYKLTGKVLTILINADPDLNYLNYHIFVFLLYLPPLFFPSSLPRFYLFSIFIFLYLSLARSLSLTHTLYLPLPISGHSSCFSGYQGKLQLPQVDTADLDLCYSIDVPRFQKKLRLPAEPGLSSLLQNPRMVVLSNRPFVATGVKRTKIVQNRTI